MVSRYFFFAFVYGFELGMREVVKTGLKEWMCSGG